MSGRRRIPLGHGQAALEARPESLRSQRDLGPSPRPPALLLLLLALSLSLITFCHFTLFVSTQDAQSGQPPDLAPDQTDPEPSGGRTRQQIVARAAEGLERVRDWSLRFGRELQLASQEATCHRALRDQFDPAKSDPARRGPYRAAVVSTDWTRAHADIVRTISTTMGWTREAVEAIVRASEDLAGNHTHDDALHADYVDVHRLYDVDELASGPDGGAQLGPDSDQLATLAGAALSDQQPSFEEGGSGNFESGGGGGGGNEDSEAPTGEPLATPLPLVMQPAGTPMPDEAASEWRTPARYLRLERHPNFGDVPISTEASAVHTPVHVYPGEPGVMNAIAWSEELTRVFRNNFAQNPRLTNQYFASPLGFMRLFPAQKWQIPRTDPDLYDARMRPWYAAGASSRKDVVVLIDSSGSMTGSRRDIAKGVTFEILDTLTDNDHFLVLKFNDIVQQVGAPACARMRLERDPLRDSKIPLKNTVFQSATAGQLGGGPAPGHEPQAQQDQRARSEASAPANGTDLDSLYLLPANGRNVRYVKTNFTLATSGIANFSHALVTAFEVLRKYQANERLGSQCNQAIMLITDGSPSDFAEIFERYNYPNAPVRVFTYLIGRETSTSDGSHTKMMACHNRGYYTHVINLAEVRETVQQYIPVMARPLVLNRTHPTTWTPAYGELTYQMLTDWIWESRRRERARAILALAAAGQQATGAGSPAPTPTQTGGQDGHFRPDIRISSAGDAERLPAGASEFGAQDSAESADGASLDEQELEALDLFGYASNPDCFWETRRNDLLTTVVQPVYDQRNRSRVVEKFLNKNVWTKKESLVRTANLLGVAAADMKINDIVALAPSHLLGPNGYAIMLTNNGLVMHHPDLRSILEPFAGDQAAGSAPGGRAKQASRILKPFFSSLDFVQVEHILNEGAPSSAPARPFDDAQTFLALRDEAVQGKTGWRELTTKRTLDCQRRVQSRRQSFYYKPLEVFPFAFLIAIPQPYGAHRLEAQVELKNARLPERLTTYFTTSDFDLWSVHPEYAYCDGPSNNTVATLLDAFQRLEEGKLNDVQWRPAESAKPPLFSPDKIICDKQLVQSLVYDALATFSFSDNCGPPSPSAESNLFSMFGVRFSFVATRSGLTRVRHYNADDLTIKREALAFARRHARAIDETFYSRTVDFNLLINETATLVQVPFNAHLKIAERLARYEAEQEQMGGGGGYGSGGVDLASEGASSPLEPTSDQQLLSSPGQQQAPPAPGLSSRLELKDMSLYEKMEILVNSSLHVTATQSIIVNEGAQRAVAGVTGVFYDYASFVMRFLNTTNNLLDESERAPMKPATCYLASGAQDEACQEGGARRPRCGHANDTTDCLLVDNNGYIVLSEQLEFVGRHLRAYDAQLMARLVSLGVFHEVNVTDYQSICVKREADNKPGPGAASSAGGGALWLVVSARVAARAIATNLALSLLHLAGVLGTLSGFLVDLALGHQASAPSPISQQALSGLLPNKSYLRPCDRVLTRYETRAGQSNSADAPQYYSAGACQCPAWFVYEQVHQTNLILLLVDLSASGLACRARCETQRQHQRDSQPTAPGSNPAPQDDDSLMTQSNIIGQSEGQVCAMFERESSLSRRRLDACISHHPDEEEIKLCGRAGRTGATSARLMIVAFLASVLETILLGQTRALVC